VWSWGRDSRGRGSSCFGPGSGNNGSISDQVEGQPRAPDRQALCGILFVLHTGIQWEPRRLRFRLLSAAAQIVTTARRRYLRFARHWPWTGVITDALDRLEALPNPG
jgi:hypothetical protein